MLVFRLQQKLPLVLEIMALLLLVVFIALPVNAEAKRGLRAQVKILWDITEFLRKLRKQMHFGDLSRAPLQLLRFEVCGSEAACEWTARPPDPWDADLPSGVRNHNEAFQALRDAIQVRELLLRTLPEVNSVLFRVYRHASRRAGGTYYHGFGEQR